MIASLIANASTFAENIAAEAGWWLIVDASVIVVLTGLLILRDLSFTNRRFDWGPVIRNRSFIALVLLQSALLLSLLIILSGFGRVTLKYGIDALWVALAGVSLLKSLPGGKSEDTQRLWNLADWLFKSFYWNLSLVIRHQSNTFKDYLVRSYQNDVTGFRDATLEFVAATATANDAVTEQKEVKTRFDALATDQERLFFLANWLVPRCSPKDWRRLTTGR